MAAKAKATSAAATKPSLAERLATLTKAATLTWMGEPTADDPVDFGRFKGKTFGDLWKDADYVKWLVERSDVLKKRPRLAAWIDMQLTAAETGVGSLPGAEETGAASSDAPEAFAFPDVDDSGFMAPEPAGSARLDAAEAQMASLTAQVQQLTMAMSQLVTNLNLAEGK